MKLAFILFRYFPHGGLQRDFLRIAEACARRGHEVHALVREWQGAAPEWLQVHSLPVSAITNHGRNRRFAARARACLADLRPDGVIGFNKVSGLDVYFAADPCYLARADQLGKPFWYRMTPRFRAFAGAERELAESDTLILALTRRQIEDFRSCYGLPESRFVLLPPGVAPDRAWTPGWRELRRQERAAFGIGDDDFMLLALGSGFRTKGLDRTLRALASLPGPLLERATLLVAGADDARPYRRLARELGVDRRVVFLGGRDDVPALLASADVLMHPAYSEAAGMVLVEALVAGVPVISTAACGYAPYVRDSGGGVVLDEPFRQEALDDTLAGLLKDPRTLSGYRDAGLRFAATADLFDMPATAARHIEAHLLNRGPVKGAAR